MFSLDSVTIWVASNFNINKVSTIYSDSILPEYFSLYMTQVEDQDLIVVATWVKSV